MTALQPLTDTQVQNRLVAYNSAGSLDRDIQGLWEDASDIIRDCTRNHFGEASVAGVERHYTSRVDAAWIQNVADFGQRLYREKQSVPDYIATRDKLIGDIIAGLFERLSADQSRLCERVTALQRLTSYETDIILAQVALLEANAAAEARGKESEQFELRVSELVTATSNQSTQLTERTRATASSARGMRYLCERRGRCGSQSPRRRILPNQMWILFFQLAVFPDERIIFGVRNLWRVLIVIKLVVMRNQLGQAHQPVGGFRFVHSIPASSSAILATLFM